MKVEPYMTTQSRPQRGFSLVSAIFLLVVIAALAAFSLTLSSTQQQSAALDVLGSRAYQAARAGIEWGAFQVMPNSAAAFATACRTGPTSQVLAGGALAGTLSGFDVVITCSTTAQSDVIPTTGAVGVVTVYRIVSVATGMNGAVPGSPDYLERQMQVTIGQ